jgi:hypothetical protein
MFSQLDSLLEMSSFDVELSVVRSTFQEFYIKSVKYSQIKVNRLRDR